MAGTTGPTRYALADDVVLQVAGDEVLLVKMADEDMFALNHTGAAIVRRLAAGATTSALIDELADMYVADRGAVERDVHAMLTDLVTRGLLVVRDE